MSIPLAVGGAIGYLMSETGNEDITISNGSIRAMLVANDDIEGDVDIDATVEWIDHTQSTTAKGGDFVTYNHTRWEWFHDVGDWNDDDSMVSFCRSTQVKNGEIAQARCGGVVGLMPGSALNISNKLSSQSVKSSNEISGYQGGTRKGRGVRFYTEATNPSASDVIFGMIPLMQDSKVGYYCFDSDITDLDKSEDIFYSIGDTDFSGTITNNIGQVSTDACYTAFNYPVFDQATKATSSLSLSNIFSKDIIDYHAMYDGNHKITMGADSYSNADLSVFNADGSGLGQKESSSSNVTVFAGYSYGETTYNRSYWLVPSDIEDKAVGFYPTQHWAGPNIGGILV